MAKIEKPEHDWQQQLTLEQFQVTRKGETEKAFTGKYYDNIAPGTYKCVCCGAELFSSDEKYESGTGWPSFWAAADDDNIETAVDQSHGMTRTEIKCSQCDAHLGHLFKDGPQPTGNRYCVNSAALDFEEQS